MTKRKAKRHAKQLRPGGLKDVILYEKGLWSGSGPLIRGREDERCETRMEAFGVRIWESWDEFFGFYAEVRDEWLAWCAEKPHREQLVAEHAYQCWLAGGDPEAEQRAIAAERDRDSRLWLWSLERD